MLHTRVMFRSFVVFLILFAQNVQYTTFWFLFCYRFAMICWMRYGRETKQKVPQTKRFICQCESVCQYANNNKENNETLNGKVFLARPIDSITIIGLCKAMNCARVLNNESIKEIIS